jgi:hypothetical protein
MGFRPGRVCAVADEYAGRDCYYAEGSMSEDKRQFEHRKEREREKAHEKQQEKEAEFRDKKGFGTPRPLWLIVLGIPLVLLIIYVWTVYASPRAG